MAQKPHVLLVEPRSLFRLGLAAWLAQIAELESVASLDEFSRALAFLEKHRPQLVLVGTGMPVLGVEFIRKIKRAYPDIRVLAIDSGEQATSVADSLCAGADGYVLIGVTRDEFSTAMRCAVAGKSCDSAHTSIDAPDGGDAYAAMPGAAMAPESMTPRECEVLILAANGNSNKSIAKCLGLSVNTVKKHRSRMMRKLDLHNVTGLTLYAIANGWVDSGGASSRLFERNPSAATAGDARLQISGSALRVQGARCIALPNPVRETSSPLTAIPASVS